VDNAARTYKILHLSDLFIDPEYMAGTDSKCRGMVCCHLLGNGKLPEDLAGEDIAGPYGHMDCDMPLGGVRQILSKLKAS